LGNHRVSGRGIPNRAATAAHADARGRRTSMGRMKTALRTAALLVLGASTALAADARKEAKYNVAAGGSGTIANSNGPVTVKSGAGRQVLIATTTHSDKVQVDNAQSGNRVESRVHTTQ